MLGIEPTITRHVYFCACVQEGCDECYPNFERYSEQEIARGRRLMAAQRLHVTGGGWVPYKRCDMCRFLQHRSIEHELQEVLDGAED